jgi:hypothetical protein
VINAGGYGITATLSSSSLSLTFAETSQAAIVGSDLTDTTTASVVETAPTLASIAGTLTVANATDILGGTLAITNALGVASTLTLGTSDSTDTLANLATTINAANYGFTAIVSSTSMTFAETAVAAIVGSSLTDTTPGIAGTLSVSSSGDLLGGSLTVTDSTGTQHTVTLGVTGTTDTLADLKNYFNATNTAWGITASIDNTGTAMTFVGSSPTAVSWYALEVMR